MYLCDILPGVRGLVQLSAANTTVEEASNIGRRLALYPDFIRQNMGILFDQPVDLTPKQFEQEVEKLLRKLGVDLAEFKVQRLEKIDAADGVYEIDVTARFEALGASFLVLIECKHHKSPIKREVVQVLFDRLRAVGGHKGMIFSTARYQRGAVEFAQVHGIALVQVADGRTMYATRTFDEPPPLPPEAPQFVGWMIGLNKEGNESFRLIFDKSPEVLVERFRSSDA